jgi:hypothetical protein
MKRGKIIAMGKQVGRMVGYPEIAPLLKILSSFQ